MKRVSIVLVAAVMILLNGYPVLAVSLIARVDKTEATLEDTVLLTLSVEGARTSDEPILPQELKRNFKIQSRGSSSRVQITNGKINSSIDYNYTLYPSKPGTFTIGPASIMVKGDTYESQSFTLQILPVQKETGPDRDLFITSKVDKLDPYVNEQIVYTFRFYRSIKVMNPRLLDGIDFEGFYIEKIGKEKEFTVTKNGEKYFVTELKQALFPTKPGKMEIPPARLQVDILYRSQRRGFFSDPFFDNSFFGMNETKTKVLVAPGITLQVRPIPVEGKPPQFSNLIGDFTISSSLEKKGLEVGDSITLTITVAGYGNIWDAVEPELNNLTDLKVYSDKPTVTKSVQEGRIYGVMTLKKALVPLKEGKIKIPPLKTAFFNPHLQQYQQIMTKPILLNVLPPSEKEKLHLVEAGGITPSKQAVKFVGKDILPLHTSLNALEHRAFNPFNMFYLIILGIPMVVYVTGLGIKKRNDRLINDQGFARRYKAMSNCGKTLKKSESHLKDKSSEEFYRLTSRALKEYLGDKFNVVGSALTPQEAEKKLFDQGSGQQVSQEVRTLLEDLEKGQFATASHTPQEREEILKRARKQVKTVEKHLR